MAKVVFPENMTFEEFRETIDILHRAMKVAHNIAVSGYFIIPTEIIEEKPVRIDRILDILDTIQYKGDTTATLTDSSLVETLTDGEKEAKVFVSKVTRDWIDSGKTLSKHLRRK